MGAFWWGDGVNMNLSKELFQFDNMKTRLPSPRNFLHYIQNQTKTHTSP